MLPSPEQQAVIDHGTSPARLLAGPGTGKSFTLSKRVAALVAAGQTPNRMLLLSFTRLAASDLASGIAEQDLGGREPPETKTLHAYAFGRLRTNSAEAFVGRYVIDSWEFKHLLRIDLGRRIGMSPGKVSEAMKGYDAAWWTLTDPPSFPQRQAFEAAVEDLRGVLRFAMRGELVHKFLEMLNGNPDFDPELDYLVVDEYQDLNRCDQEVIRRLTARGAALLVAGDDDQSLYGFRHANPDGIIGFPEEFDPCGDYSLSECHRCAAEVLEPALRLIEHNPSRAAKALHSTRTGGEVHVYSFRGQRHQAEGVAKIVAAERERTALDQIFILLPRKNFASMYLEELAKEGILAVDLANGSKLLDENDVRRLIYLLRFAVNREDAVAIRGWLATTPRLGPELVGRVLDLAIAERLDLATAIEGAGVAQAKEAFGELVSLADQLEPEGDALEVFELASQMVELEPGRRDGFRQVIEVLTGDEPALKAVLAVLHEYRDQPEAGDAVEQPVKLMSLHGAKGLSADVVIVPDVEDLIIPGDSDVVEQRRLMYVSMTRARHRLYICHALFRTGATSYAGAGARAPGPERRRSKFLNEAGLVSESIKK